MERMESNSLIQVVRDDCIPPESPGVSVMRVPRVATNLSFHRHHFYELVFVVKGDGVHITENGEYSLKPGNIFLIRPGCAHGYKDRFNMEMVNILFDPKRMPFRLDLIADCRGYQAFFETSPKLTDSFRLGNCFHCNSEQSSQTQNLIRKIELEQKQKPGGWKMAVCAGFLEIVLLISRAVADSECGEFDELLSINRLLKYVEDHYTEKIDVETIAAYGNMSVRSLQRRFKQCLGKSPCLYLNDLRLSKAADLLIRTGQSVTEVAAAVGIEDSNYFSGLFRRRYERSPRDYRKKFRSGD